MNPMVMILLSCGMLLVVALCTGAAIFFFQRYASPEPSLIQNRLIQMKQRQGEEDIFLETETARKMARLYKDAEYDNEALGKKLEKFAPFLMLKVALQQAGLKTPADKFLIMNMMMPMAALFVLGLLSGFAPLTMIGLVSPGGAWGYVLFMRHKRLHKFTTQLPDALSMITSSLRAGHSFQSALTIVSSEMPEPLSTEFTSMVRDINLGIPVKEAMNRMVRKLDSLPDVRMFSTAVMIQREAGGNLAEVLEKLGYTIRERFKLKGQISALTGQSRMTGYVLGGAPFLLLAGLTLIMYDYVRPLYETDLGKVLLGVAAIMQMIGFFVMKKIVDIRV